MVKKQVQKPLFVELDESENVIVKLLQQTETMHVDELQLSSKLSSSKLAAVLLGLEMRGVIYSLPGKRYKL